MKHDPDYSETPNLDKFETPAPDDFENENIGDLNPRKMKFISVSSVTKAVKGSEEHSL